MRVTTIRRVITVAGLAAVASVHVPATSATLEARGGYVWRNVEIVGGGYVPGIVFNPTEPDLVYARTDIGGAYRWEAATGRWIPLLDWVGWDDWNLTGVDSLATDPVDPDRVYVLAGTYTNNFTDQNGAVLRSRNRGRTWQRSDLPFKVGGNMPGRNVGERLAIDPNKDSILFLGARSGNGLWKSADFGKTWERVTSFPATGTYVENPGDGSGYASDPLGVMWVVFDPRSGSRNRASGTIYVGVAELGMPGVYRSLDGGTTWAALAGQPIGFMPHHGVLAANGVLYLTYNNKGGPFDGDKGDVWKYETTAGAWTKISPVPSTSGDDYFGYGGLAVDAQHPDTVMVAALNSWWPDTMIWRSTNGGATWSRIWDWGNYPDRLLRYVQDITGAPWLTFGELPAPPVPSPKLGWMVGDLEIDPHNSDKMLYGTGATIYGSDDLTSWDAGNPITISVKAQGLEETAVQDIISPPEGAPLLSALGDIAGFRHDDLAVVPATMYTNPITGTTTSLDYAELSPGHIVRAGWGQWPYAGTSADGGATWTPVGSSPGGGGTIAVSADAGSIVWSTDGAGVHYSTNNGASWTASMGLANGARVASDRVNPSKFYAVAGGTFYVSTDHGASFTATAATGLPPASIRFKAVPGFEGHVWLAGGTSDSGIYGLWSSQDSGATFVKLANVQRADTIGFGMAAPGKSYPTLYTSAQIYGTRGIFRSINAGRTWMRINDNQHQYAWTGQAITGDPRVYGRVYVTTNGRGVVYGEPAP